VGYTSPVQTEIMKDLDLTKAEYSLFGSMINIGGIFGAILCGKTTDYLGRKNVLRLIDLVYIFGWICISVSQVISFSLYLNQVLLYHCWIAAWLLDLGRWMLGFAVAVTVPVYLAEFTPKNLRGGFVVFHVLMVTVGTSAVFIIGLITSWRTLALIGTIHASLHLNSVLVIPKFWWFKNFYVPGIIPSLVQVAGSFFIPESPRWLMMMSKNKEFEAALQRLRGSFADISQEAADIRDCVESLHQMEQVSTLQLFQKKYAYALTVGIGLTTLSCLVGLSGIMLYANSIFESVGVSPRMGTIALALFQLPSMGLGMILMDKCGRRPLLM
ncbi:Sugar transporter ERD6-like 5, partial [Bienertia sinuspersici]